MEWLVSPEIAGPTTGLAVCHSWQTTICRDISFSCSVREIAMRQWKSRYNEDPSAGMRVVLGMPAGIVGSVVADY